MIMDTLAGLAFATSKPRADYILEHPIKKEIDISGFKLIKAKIYADKQISYLEYINW